MIAVEQLSPDALLAHAHRLVGEEDRGTSEHALDLRRAASGAYHAAFHELCLQAAAQISGCPRRASRTQAWHVLRNADQQRLPPHLLEVAEQIASLRELRHAADYDRLAILDHDHVAAAVEQAEEVVEPLREHSASPAYRGFFVLVAMSARRRLLG